MEEKLSVKWQKFARTLADPWTLVLWVATIFILAFSFSLPDTTTAFSQFLFVIFPILLAFIAAILGGRIAKQLAESAEETRLITRGKSAIRNLKLLFINLANLESRIKPQLARQNNQQSSGSIYNNDIVDLSMMMIKEEVIHAIEDWIDIIPEANLKTHFEYLTELKLALHFSEKECERIQNELSKTKRQSRKENEALKQRLQAEEKVITQLRERLLERKHFLDNSILSGLSTSILKTGNTIQENTFVEQELASVYVSWNEPEADKEKFLNVVNDPELKTTQNHNTK